MIIDGFDYDEKSDDTITCTVTNTDYFNGSCNNNYRNECTIIAMVMKLSNENSNTDNDIGNSNADDNISIITVMKKS